AFRVGRAFELRPVDAGLAGETEQSSRRLAGCIQRDVDVRTETFAALLGLGEGYAWHPYGKAPRRREGLRVFDVGRDAAFRQAVAYASRECARKIIDRVDRQFFHADFDQQGLGA